MKVWMKHSKKDREENERMNRMREILIASDKFNDLRLSAENAQSLIDALAHDENRSLVDSSDNDQILDMALKFAQRMVPQKRPPPSRGAARVLDKEGRYYSQGSVD